MSKLSYELLRGRLVLADGVTITESGTTDDPAIIKALRKDDPEAACFVNDTWSAKIEETEVAFDDGEEFTLTASEAAKVRNFILHMRGDLRKAA